MKFERLNVPNWPLPDLVAFNERVHAVVDPWWARVWVRRIAWARDKAIALRCFGSRNSNSSSALLI